jgi:hypothetical protein
MMTKIKNMAKLKVTPLDSYAVNLVHEDIRAVNGHIIYQKWLFRPEDFRCGTCGRPDDVVFMRCAPINVVIASCRRCKTSQQVLAKNPSNNSEIAVACTAPIELTQDEAIEFIERNKIKQQFYQPELAALLKVRERRAIDLADVDLVDVEVED